ncbi:uncharacterized protein LOC122008592 isoform X2 [Zingiber officinale]|nr:uncharacterized protein LOC122008592 isoform X2 [Zingiber officinale]
MTVCASQDGMHNPEQLDQQSSFKDDPNNYAKELTESENDESCDLQNLSRTVEGIDMHILTHKDPNPELVVEEACTMNGVKTFLKPPQQLDNSSSMSGRIENFAESPSSFGQEKHDSISGSSTTSSNLYDDSVSSVDDHFSHHTPRKRIGVSRRTFRQKKVVDSADIGHKGTQDQAQELPEDQPVDRLVPNAVDLPTSLDIVAPTENKSPRRRDTSHISEDFHSVQNWFEPEEDAPLKYLTVVAEILKGSAYSQTASPSVGFHSPEYIKMEILKKVDELRKEISKMFNKSDEGMGISHANFVPNSCCHNGICTACHHDKPCNCCNTVSPEMLHNKEIRHQKKRHSRPVLGGAPFVICYNCMELLQLPIDFFVVKKRLYKLRCGACSKLLVFSFRAPNPKGAIEKTEQSTSEKESLSHTYASLRYEIPNSHLNDRSRSESISHSERECGDHMDKRCDKNVTNGRQLHQLMGYESASELIYQHSRTIEDFDYIEQTSSHFNSFVEPYLGDGRKETPACIFDAMTSDKYKNFLEGKEETESPEPSKSGTGASPLHELMKIMRHASNKKVNEASD